VVRTPFAARRWGVETVSGYLMDTVDLTPALTAFAGVRVDRFTFDVSQFHTSTGAPNNFAGRTTNRFEYSDTLWNGHLGVTYKVGGGGVFYASVSTAADINGGEADTSGAGYGGFILDDTGTRDIALPERSWNYEIGTKWNVLDEKLLLTASLFRTVKSGIMEGADYGALGSFNTGKLRVQGVELGIAGNITDRWSVHGGFTVMRAKILESADTLGTGSVNATNLPFNPTNVGKTISNFANVSAQFMTRYDVTDKLTLGGAFKYKSERYGGQPDTAAVYTYSGQNQFYYSQPVPSYFVVDAMAEYHLTKNIELKLNVNNLFNTNYYLAAYRAGFFLYKGDKRQVVGTLSVKF
jgi:catecholate siderophore receptor